MSLRCPKCASAHVWTTLLGMDGRDTNKAHCDDCKWSGRAHDARQHDERYLAEVKQVEAPDE